MNSEQLCLPLCPCVHGWELLGCVGLGTFHFIKNEAKSGAQTRKVDLTQVVVDLPATEGILKSVSLALTSSPFG